MTIPIKNAKDRKLGQNTGTLPDVTGGLLDWFQPMNFLVLTKSVVNYKNKETARAIKTMGLWQPFSPRNLQIMEEGQRSWSWFRMFTLPGNALEIDNIISYLGVNYRVMGINDYTLNGYVEYRLIQDYTGPKPCP